MNDMNSFFEKIFVISLARRNDRLREFMRQFKGMGIDWDIEVFQAVDGSLTGCPDWWMVGRGKKEREGSWGCYCSHTEIWEKALTNKWRNVLIFEDDCEFEKNFKENLQTALNALPIRWDFLYLGGEMVRSSKQKPFNLNDCLLYAFNVNRTHSYCLNASIIKTLYLECKKKNVVGSYHIDWQMGNVQERPEVVSLAIHPWITSQRGGQSDITGVRKKEFFAVKQINTVKTYGDLKVASSTVGYGDLAVGGSLGYENKVVDVLSPQGFTPISAHAPSKIILNNDNSIEIFGAQNGDMKANRPHTAIVNGEPIGTVQNAHDRTIAVTLNPGVNTLEYKATDNDGRAHTVWFYRTIPNPVSTVTEDAPVKVDTKEDSSGENIAKSDKSDSETLTEKRNFKEQNQPGSGGRSHDADRD